MAVFSDMQVKQESSVSDLISASESSPLHHHHNHDHQQCRNSPCCSSDNNTLTTTTTQDMQTCQASITTSLSNISNSHLLQQQQDKSSSGYSLWAEYFDAFPVLTEFDLRSGVNGSTGTSIASSSSASSENWPSPGSGTPFSDCEQDDTAFIDDHAVPTSVIDEIVQTLKMDGYNFDHLGDDIMDSTNTTSYPVKQEQDMSNQQPCYLQSPVYTSLCPPKLQLHPESSAARKYVNMNDNSMHTCNDSNNNINYMNNNMNNLSIFDQVMDGKWCDNTTSLPSMTISLQQIQQHTTQLQQPIIVQQHQPGMQQQQHQNGQQQMSHDQLQPQQHQIQTYASSPVEDNTMTGAHYTSSTSMFPGSYAPLQPLQQYKFMTTSPVALQPPPLVQTCEKSTETKPRRRRSTNSSARVEKPHLCTECGAAFKLSANLKQHLVIHTGEKPFSCDICKAMFTRLSSLKTHHRLHTGEKPHICPFCNAAFADRSAMKAHKRIHTGERPYKCTVCSTSFTQLSHLNAHKRTHTGEKPYACGICGTTFKQLGHLKRHEKSHVCSRM